MSRIVLTAIVLACAAALCAIGLVAPSASPQAQSASAAATVTPQKYDFGKVPVGSQAKAVFRVRVTPPLNPSDDWKRKDPIQAGFLGPPLQKLNVEGSFQVGRFREPDPFDQTTPMADTTRVRLDWCSPVKSSRTVECEVEVYFAPKALGRHSDQLFVLDPDRWTAAAVTGEGIQGCVMKVVPCNYGPMYTGTFSWNRELAAPGSSHKENVEVHVAQGVASCHGSVTDTENGQSTSGTVDGPGLFAVEFEPDKMHGQLYLVTVACPTPAFPAIPADGVEATKAQPAELGHNDMTSQKQPAKEVAEDRLEGAIRYSAPETDLVNNVKGVVSVSWSLKQMVYKR